MISCKILKGYIILSILILLKYSPVDSENRKLDQEERKKES
ncbi:accessory gene regulator B family protein [Sellimonas intestinalis]